MTDELQSDEVLLDEAQTTESEAELATASGENQTKNEDGDVTEATRKAINKQHAKYREEERKRLQVEKELQAANERLQKLEAEKGEVVIPDLPDSWDDDYETKMQQREEAIKRQAIQEAKHNLAIEQQNAQKEAAKQADQERINGLIETYDKQISKLGLNPSEIRKAGDTVVEYGISGEVAEFILGQEDGPLITKYLADNPLELDDLRNMRPIDAALRISSTIREAASTLKPQASNAPDPAETLAGRGAGEQVSPLIKGVTFE